MSLKKNNIHTELVSTAKTNYIWNLHESTANQQNYRVTKPYFWFSKKKVLMQSSKNEKKCCPKTQGFCPKPED